MLKYLMKNTITTYKKPPNLQVSINQELVKILLHEIKIL